MLKCDAFQIATREPMSVPGENEFRNIQTKLSCKGGSWVNSRQKTAEPYNASAPRSDGAKRQCRSHFREIKTRIICIFGIIRTLRNLVYFLRLHVFPILYSPRGNQFGEHSGISCRKHNINPSRRGSSIDSAVRQHSGQREL